MPIVEQELLPLLEHLSSPPIQTVDVFDRNPKFKYLSSRFIVVLISTFTTRSSLMTII
jgi:hypothetical protein